MKPDQPAVINNLIALIYTTASGENTWQSLLSQFSDLLEKEIHGNELDALLDQLHFHFDKAREIQLKRDSLMSQHDAFANTLDHLPLAIVICYANGQIFQTNTHAKKLLSDGHSIHKDKQSRLCLTGLARQTKQLHQATSDLLALNSNHTIRNLPIDYPDDNSHISITLVPTTHHPELKESGERLVTLYISSVSIRHKISQLWLQQTYNLQPHEGRLAYLLINDCENLAEAAKKLGLSVQTVRSYLKNIFLKTDTHSQPTFIKRILKDAPFLYGLPDQPEQNTEKLLPSQAHFFRLNDGRQLAYAEYGTPEGRPVLFFHSYIGSRLQVHPDMSILTQTGARLIVPERPGFGLSDPTEKRTLEKYAEDIRQLLDHLKIAQVPIIGFCIGSTFAFACASILPDRVEKLVIINPLGQVDSPGDLKGMLPLNRMILRVGLLSPVLMRNLVSIVFRDFSTHPEKLLKYLQKHMTDSDKNTLANADILAMLASCYHETLRQSSDALYQELLLCLSPWENLLASVETKVELIHGRSCNHVPLHFGKRIARQLPNCESYYPKDGGFYVIFEQWREILELSLKPL